jgi:hypothetical protein
VKVERDLFGTIWLACNKRFVASNYLRSGRHLADEAEEAQALGTWATLMDVSFALFYI